MGTLNMHSKLTIATNSEEYIMAIHYYNFLHDMYDYEDEDIEEDRFHINITVNRKDITQWKSVTDEVAVIEAIGCINSLTADPNDHLYFLDENTKYTYSFAGAYYSYCDNVIYKIKDGNYVDPIETDDISGSKWTPNEETLIINGDFSNYPDFDKKYLSLTERMVPKSQKEQWDSFIEDFDDRVDGAYLFYIDWYEDLGALKAYLNELNKLLDTAKDCITSVSYNYTWLDINTMRLATVKADEDNHLHLVVYSYA